MSSKRGSKETEFPELEGVMFISPAERAKAEARIRAQREAEAAAKAEAARIEEVRARWLLEQISGHEQADLIWIYACIPREYGGRCGILTQKEKIRGGG